LFRGTKGRQNLVVTVKHGGGSIMAHCFATILSFKEQVNKNGSFRGKTPVFFFNQISPPSKYSVGPKLAEVATTEEEEGHYSLFPSVFQPPARVRKEFRDSMFRPTQ